MHLNIEPSDAGMSERLPTRAEWLDAVAIRDVWSRYAEAAEQQLCAVRAQIIGRVVALFNVVVSFASPFVVRLEGDGALVVDVDWERWQWLGWRDYPSGTPAAAAQYELLEEILRKELKLAARAMWQSEAGGRALLKYRVERDWLIEGLRRDIDEIKGMLPVIAEKIRNKQAAAQGAGVAGGA